jgi:mannose-6-phosphate isomerase-like protein (cupin superfamily)
VPENHLAKLAKLVTVKILNPDEEISIQNEDNTDNVIIVLRGELVAVNTDENTEEQIFGKNEIITSGINLKDNIRSLKSKVKTTLLLARRFDYYNLLVDETEIMQHIFEEVSGDE